MITICNFDLKFILMKITFININCKLFKLQNENDILKDKREKLINENIELKSFGTDNQESEENLKLRNGILVNEVKDREARITSGLQAAAARLAAAKEAGDLAAEVEELEVQLNDQTGKSIAMAEQLEGYKKEAIIREASKDLAETQIEKLKSLVEKIDFEDEESFTKKVSTVKESYFNKKASAPNEIEELEEEASDEVETTGSMSQYVNALKTQIKS